MNFAACVGDIANVDGALSCSTTALPEGSYLKSCRFARALVGDSNQATLYANCRTVSASWNWTQLAGVEHCVTPGDIANLDGTLTCKAPDGILPPGTYEKSCRNVRKFQGVLYAECRTRSGNWLQSQMTLEHCSMGITNNDGTLVCGDPAPPLASFNTMRILVLNGNTGKPMANVGLFVSLCCSRSTTNAQWLATNGAGEIVVSYVEGSQQLKPMMASAKYKYCQGTEAHETTIVNPSFFVLDEIQRAGVVAPNNCNSHVRPSPQPGVLVFFLREFTWWEGLTKPPQM